MTRWRLASLWRDSDELGYGVLLTLIAVTYVASVAFFNPVGVALVLLLQVFVLLVVLRVSHARRVLLRAANLALLLTIVVVVLGLVVQPSTEERSPVLIALYVLSALLYGVAPVSLLRHTLARPQIDLQTLVAAIAAYAMLGMFFAFAYRATATIQTAPFFGASGPGNMADDLFFSFVTLTTTGYGNLVPAGNPGQTLAVLEAIVGQLFLVTAVAKIVNESGLLSSRRFHLDAEHPKADQQPAAASGSDPAAEPQAP